LTRVLFDEVGAMLEERGLLISERDVSYEVGSPETGRRY
jgi:hypothetical protein